MRRTETRAGWPRWAGIQTGPHAALDRVWSESRVGATQEMTQQKQQKQTYLGVLAKRSRKTNVDRGKVLPNQSSKLFPRESSLTYERSSSFNEALGRLRKPVA